MPRTSEHSATELGSRKARQRLPLRSSPYYAHIADGLTLGYRRAARGGTWIARRVVQSKLEGGAKGSARYEENALGSANDAVENVGMNFQQAQDVALAWFKQAALEEAGEVVSGPYTVSQAMAEYVTNRERIKRKTLAATRSAIKAHIDPHLGSIQLSKLTKSKIKQWFEALASSAPRTRTGFVKERRMVERNVKGKIKRQYRERVTAERVTLDPAFSAFNPEDKEVQRKRQATANRILTILKAGLNHAVKVNDRQANRQAWQDVKPFHKVDVPKIIYLEMDEVTVFLGASADDLGTIVRGALLTGCRYGELANMLIEHFYPQQEQIYITESKNGEARFVELTEEGIAFFTALVKGRSNGENIFLRSNGKPWKKSEQKRPMDEALAASKINKPVTFHVLRHTYASHLAMNGTPMRTIADQLGHKDTRITERHYAHLSRKHVRDTIRRNLPSFGLGNDSQQASHTS
jgi:integrase